MLNSPFDHTAEKHLQVKRGHLAEAHRSERGFEVVLDHALVAVLRGLRQQWQLGDVVSLVNVIVKIHTAADVL
jgi:hypothetical protein